MNSRGETQSVLLKDPSTQVGWSSKADAEQLLASHTHTLVIGPYLKERPNRAPDKRISLRAPEARLEEAAGLALAIDLDVLVSQLVFLTDIRPATFIGVGKIEEFAEIISEREIALVVMDCALSPVQQRNLEKSLGAKVIDRTGLILEIFGRRARTREGALQVELAHLTYQKSRLVRSWTHLERQRGGFGFLGGPGETQIETDRRLIQERMVKIERELEGVKKTRGLHRKSREDVPFPLVALVGYTNAGKSTLFNSLTDATVLAQDMLFATLDPTWRALKLPHGGKIILSDTVGFISDLPTMLVSAFRATLEEVISADVILHVRDIAHEDAQAQGADVDGILKTLGIDPDDHDRVIEVWNKIDQIESSRRDSLLDIVSQRAESGRPMLVSAVTGEGLDVLKQSVETRISRGRSLVQLALPPQDGANLHWIYENAEILSRTEDDEGVLQMTLRVAPERLDHLIRRFPASRIDPLKAPSLEISDL